MSQNDQSNIDIERVFNDTLSNEEILNNVKYAIVNRSYIEIGDFIYHEIAKNLYGLCVLENDTQVFSIPKKFYKIDNGILLVKAQQNTLRYGINDANISIQIKTNDIIFKVKLFSNNDYFLSTLVTSPDFFKFIDSNCNFVFGVPARSHLVIYKINPDNNNIYNELLIFAYYVFSLYNDLKKKIVPDLYFYKNNHIQNIFSYNESLKPDKIKLDIVMSK